MTIVRIDGRRVVDAKTFHDVLATTFGLPKTYGKNLDALVDCLTHIDDPKSGMTTVHVPMGGTLAIAIDHSSEFGGSHRDLFASFCEAIAFVNWRRVEKGQPPVLALAFSKV